MIRLSTPRQDGARERGSSGGERASEQVCLFEVCCKSLKFVTDISVKWKLFQVDVVNVNVYLDCNPERECIECLYNLYIYIYMFVLSIIY